VRVLTWNLWWRFGDWAARQEAIEAVLRREQPDVCCLQEVWATPQDDLAGVLARRLGWHHAFAPSTRPGRWQARADQPGVTVGNAVLSRWPVTSVEHGPLPSGEGLDEEVPDEEGLALHAVVAAPGGAVPVSSVHLSSAPAHSAVRVAQVGHLARSVAARAGTGHPAVVAGDFNALPESDEVRLFEGLLTAPAVPGRVMVDAWRYADPGDAGPTWDRRNPHVLATGEPSARVDYVFVAPAGPGAGRVVSARVVGDRPEGGVWPSDHSAVLVALAPAGPDGDDGAVHRPGGSPSGS
jgi:endonuclease/exonuclease/phosphatase family metal-dependent hydrolase